MNIAILGLPQSGKRTLFSLLTGRGVSEFRKAGETLEGMALVHDPRVDAIARMENPEKITYAQTEIVLCTDIEPGSGKYVWLEQARYCDLLCMVVHEYFGVDHEIAWNTIRNDHPRLISKLQTIVVKD